MKGNDMGVASARAAGRQWSRTYSIASAVIGWLVIAGYVVAGALVIAGFRGGGDIWFMLMQVSYAASMIGFGLVVIMAGQVVAYVFGRDEEPGHLVHCGHLLLWSYAGLRLLAGVFSRLWLATRGIHVPWDLYATGPFLAAITALVLVGLGLVLQRLVPVVREWKSLV
jgi:hypothetical protein